MLIHKKSRFDILCAGLALIIILSAPPAPADDLKVAGVGNAVALLPDSRRVREGIATGPDSIFDVIKENQFFGNHDLLTVPPAEFLLFSGSNEDHLRGVFRLRGHNTAVLNPSPAVSGKVSPVMQPSRFQRIPAALGGISDDTGLSADFDRDYAGGGTTLNFLVDTGSGPFVRTLYFYHGEYHSSVDSDGNPIGGSCVAAAGWTGLGLAYSDDGGFSFTKAGQIIGLNAPNGMDGATFDASRDEQMTALSGQANAFYNVSDGYIYLFYRDELADHSNASCSDSAGRPQGCVTIGRAKAHDLLEAIENNSLPHFTKYLDSGTGTSADALFPEGMGNDGLGGIFTPLFNDPKILSPFVTYDRALGKFLMVFAYGHTSIEFLSSDDGLHWDISKARALASPPAGRVLLYPALVRLKSETGGSPLYLTYTSVAVQASPCPGKTDTIRWKDGASVERREIFFK